MHQRWRCPRTHPEHLLLDHLHVHATVQRTQRRRTSWPRQRLRRRETHTLLLPVGAVHAILPGKLTNLSTTRSQKVCRWLSFPLLLSDDRNPQTSDNSAGGGSMKCKCWRWRKSSAKPQQTKRLYKRIRHALNGSLINNSFLRSTLVGWFFVQFVS